MKTISENQKQIKSTLSACCLALGFDISKSPSFYNCRKDIVRIVHIDFLNKNNAAYFNSNTASFTLNLGIFFDLSDHQNLYPKEYEAQIRGKAERDFHQKHPMNLKGFPLFHPERRRRDIWWVEKDGANLDFILVNASRIITQKAIGWLDKYSDINYIIDFLKNKKEIDSGPFGFGVIGSPCRQNLINRLENKNG